MKHNSIPKRIDRHDLDMVAFESDPMVRARQAVTAVDAAMQRNYAALKAQLVGHLSPVIVVDNDDRGGQYTLIHDGRRETLCPIAPAFELAKSVSHTALGIYVLIAPYLKQPEAAGWIDGVAQFRTVLERARANLAGAGLPDDAYHASRKILDGGIGFIDESIASRTFGIERFDAFTSGVHDAITTNMICAARAQVAGVHALMKRWKTQLGDLLWKELYVVVLSIWTTSVRNQNSIILKPLMDPKNVDTHLVDIATAEKPADPIGVALDNLARIVQDNIAAEMVFPTDHVLADSLKGPDDLLSNEIGKIIQCPYSRQKVAGYAAAG